MIQPRDIRYISRLFIILPRYLCKVNNPLPLLTLATPACFAGNSKPDPPPSPRLGGGCVLGFAEANIAGTTDCGFRKERARPFLLIGVMGIMRMMGV